MVAIILLENKINNDLKKFIFKWDFQKKISNNYKLLKKGVARLKKL